MTHVFGRLILGCALLAPLSAFAQEAPSPPNRLSPRLWLVVGSGFAAAQARCPVCASEALVTQSHPVLIDAGVRATSRVDTGIELSWAPIKVNGEDPINTTFVLGVVQMKPWIDRGLFLRAGMGIGIAGHGLYSHVGQALAPPYTTNALALSLGVGWEQPISRRLAVQVHATQHVAAFGELTTSAGERLRNVVGNYWTVGWAIVIH